MGSQHAKRPLQKIRRGLGGLTLLRSRCSERIEVIDQLAEPPGAAAVEGEHEAR